MRNPIVIVSGRIASGKTIISEALADALGVRRTGFGDEVRARAVADGRPSTREVLQEIGERLVANEPEEFCRAVLLRGLYQPGQGLVVDGLRHVEILNLFRSLVAPYRLIHLHLQSDDELRQERANQRNRAGENALPLNQDSHSTEKQVIEQLPSIAEIVADTGDSVPITVAAILDKLRMLDQGDNNP